MPADQNQQKGLYWTPRGGNNAKDIWASCHTFDSVAENKKTGKSEKTTVIIDLGQNEVPQAFADGTFKKVVPALDDCLNVPGMPAAENPAQAVFLTHCHSDHTAGIFEYLHMGVKLPEIYGSEYTLNSLRKGLIEQGFAEDKWPEMKEIKPGDVVQVGNLTVEAFAASHSVPGCFSFKLSNEEASVFHSGDTKADETSFLGQGVDLSAYDKIGQEGGVDLMTFDATATHLKGRATYEKEIFTVYRQLFAKYKGRQVVAALPSAHMERLASVVSAAQAAGRDVVIDGGASMQSNIMALQIAGYDLQEKCPDIRIVSANSDKAGELKPWKTVKITTGIYAEENSPFVQYLTGKSDRFSMQRDAVVIVPTSNDNNEKLPALLQEKKLPGIKVITGRECSKIYGSGHAQADDFKKIAQSIRPAVVAPMHCSKRKARDLNLLAMRSGIQTLPAYPHNGTTVCVNKQGCRIVAEKSPEWFGLNHAADKTTFVKVGDHGYSMPENAYSLDKRQKQAVQKIADYRRKKGFSRKVSLIKREGRGA